MMGWLFIATSLIGFLSGIFVLAKGDWHAFGLKFAAVSISTICAGWLLVMLILQSGIPVCNFDALYCLQWQMYGMTRNIAFIIFHITVGRDAIYFKQSDRRKRNGSAPTRGMKRGKGGRGKIYKRSNLFGRIKRLGSSQ